jgi:hypothetical protein
MLACASLQKSINIRVLYFIRQEFITGISDKLSGLTPGSVVGVVAAYRGDLKFERQQRRKNQKI